MPKFADIVLTLKNLICHSTLSCFILRNRIVWNRRPENFRPGTETGPNGTGTGIVTTLSTTWALFRSKFMVPSGLPRPVPVIVRQFTKEQMSKVIADKLKERQARDDVEHENDIQWEDEVR